MLRELQLSQLSTAQKLGMTMTAHVYQLETEAASEENLEYALNMIRNHALGAIWVDPGYRREEVMGRIRDAADYPILIIDDTETGFSVGVFSFSTFSKSSAFSSSSTGADCSASSLSSSFSGSAVNSSSVARRSAVLGVCTAFSLRGVCFLGEEEAFLLVFSSGADADFCSGVAFFSSSVDFNSSFFITAKSP